MRRDEVWRTEEEREGEKEERDREREEKKEGERSARREMWRVGEEERVVGVCGV